MLFYQVFSGWAYLGKLGILLHQDYWTKTLLFSDATQAKLSTHHLKSHQALYQSSVRLDWVAESLEQYRSKWRLANAMLFAYDNRPEVRLAFLLKDASWTYIGEHSGYAQKVVISI